MNPSCQPGAPPAVTRDYFHRLPRRASAALSNAEQRVYLHVLEHLDEGGWFAGDNAQVGWGAGVHPATAGRIIGRLARECPPGIDHPYFAIEGGTRGRRIRVLYQPKGAPHKQPIIRSQTASNLDDIRSQTASNNRTQTPVNQGVPDLPLFKCIGGEENNVNVVLISNPEKPRTHAREADPGPTTEPTLPRASPPVAAPIADGVDRDLAGLTAPQLRERIAAMESRRDQLRGRKGRPHRETEELCLLVGRIAEARALLEALERPQDATPTPKVESIVPPAAVATAGATAAPPRKPEFQAVLGRLKRAAGPGPIEDYARFVAESLNDGHSVAHHRRIAEEIRAGKVDSRRALEAYRKARNGAMAGTARSPGAVYTAHIRNLE